MKKWVHLLSLKLFLASKIEKRHIKNMGIEFNPDQSLPPPPSGSSPLGDKGASNNPVSDFIYSLNAWKDDPSRTSAEKTMASAILSEVDPNITPDKLESTLTDFFNAKTPHGRSIFFEFPGVQPDDLQQISKMLSGYTIALPTASQLDTAFYTFYTGGISNPHFSGEIKNQLDSYANSSLNDQDAFSDFENYVKNDIITDPQWPMLSAGDRSFILQIGWPLSVTPPQQGMINAQLQNLNQTMTNFYTDLQNYKNTHASAQAITDLENRYQKIIDDFFARPGGPFEGQLESVGFTNDQISDIFSYLKADTGLNRELSDPVVNFIRNVDNWKSNPDVTAVEKQFADALLALPTKDTTGSSLADLVQKFFNQHSASARDIFFAFPGIIPQDLFQIAGMFPAGTIQIPHATNLDNALYRLCNDWSISDPQIRQKIYDQLSSYNGKFPDDPAAAFADFQNFVKTTIFTDSRWSQLSSIDQEHIEELADCQPAPPAVKPPVAANGSANFTYVNQSGVDDSQVYIQVVGSDPSGKQCFIKYNRDGSFTYIYPKPGDNSQQYSFPLSFFEKSADGKGRTIYLPEGGMRIYTSIDESLKFSVSTVKDKSGQDINVINAPNPLNPNDPDYLVHWDKTEFTISKDAIFINPTAVNNYSLSLALSETDTSGKTQSSGVQTSSKEVMDEAKKTMTGDWGGLIQNDRIISPIDAALSGSFPQDFFTKTGWIDAFKKIFSSTNQPPTPLQIDLSDSLNPGEGGITWKLTIDPNTNELIITGDSPLSPIKLKFPTNTSDILSGTGAGWGITSQPGVLQTLENALVRDFSCAIETNTLTTKEPLNTNYFISHKSQFFQPNSEAGMPQYIDEYSKLLHQYGNIYTTPYDDKLEEGGNITLHPQEYTGGSITLGPIT